MGLSYRSERHSYPLLKETFSPNYAEVMLTLQGIIADHIGIPHAFFLPALCYIYIAYFAFHGCRHTSAPRLS